MKFFVFAWFVVVLGASQSSAENVKRSALKRSIRSTLQQTAAAFADQLKTMIVQNCVQNGFVDIGDELMQSFAEGDACALKKRIYVDSKEDYIHNLRECSIEPVNKVKSCLTRNQSYYPEFSLNKSIKQVELLYDDREIITVYMPLCMKVFNNPPVYHSYMRCLTDLSKDVVDKNRIPDSLEEFCSQYLPAVRCYTDIIGRECSRFPKVQKYIQDYLRASDYPCTEMTYN